MSVREASARSMSSTRSSLNGLADFGLVLHHAVIGVQHEPVDEDRVAHRARLIAAATASACTVGATSCTRTMRGAVLDGQKMRGERAAEPSVGLGRRDRMDEALARSADQERQAEAAPVRRAARCRSCSAPASCRSRCRDRARCARARCRRAPAMSSERAKNAVTSATMSIAGSARVAIVHDDDRRAVLGDDARHVGVALQAPDVVDDRRALLERPGGDRGLERIDRDRDAERDDGRQDRRKPRALLVERHARPHRHRAASIPRRYRGCRRLRRQAAAHARWPPADRESGRRRKTNPA